MASLPRRLLLQSRQCPSRIRCRASPPLTSRSISTTPRRLANDDSKPAPPRDTPSKAAAPEEQTKSTKLSEDDIAAAQLAQLVADLKTLDPAIPSDAQRKGAHGIPYATDFDLETDEHFAIEEDDRRKVQAGFWAEGEESMGPDEDYYGDDLTSHGHAELRQHRQLREYARLAAWELPLLSQLAQPFTPPTSSTPFRFRYTSYLGESHPATNKIVCEFSPLDLSLPAPSVAKLIKLAGPRYNPTSQLIKLSCEKFDTQAQNKRDVGDTIAKLVAEAKDMTDSFEDVPFDFRHQKVKKRWEFPASWALTPERKKYLEKSRRKKAEIEDRERENGRLVDGRKVIETSLPFVSAVQEPVMVTAGTGAGARGKQMA